MKTPSYLLSLTLAVTSIHVGAEAAPGPQPQPASLRPQIGIAVSGASFQSTLRDELIAMAEEDQRVRRGDGAATPRERINEMRRIDSRNEARMKEIVAQYGWPGKSLVGSDAATKAWLIVQHCELAFQEECLPRLEQAVAAGDALAKDYAYLLDRVRMRRGELQVYGTQFKTVDGDTAVYPIENPEGVEARRRAVGLPPLAEQMKRMGLAARGPQFSDALRAELAAMAAEEQRSARTVLAPDQLENQKRRHADRTRRLKEIIAQHGWPGRSLVGSDGAFNVWLLVQNSADPAFIEECLPLLKRAVNAGEANARSYAYLLDAVRMSKGEPQLYGTQLTSGADGRLALHPIEDRTQVNERRRSVGLEPIEDYERRMQARPN